MSIMLAVAGCMAASGSDPYANISLPPTMNVEESSYGNISKVFVFNIPDEWVGWQGEASHRWNETGVPIEDFEIRLRKVSGANPTGPAALDTWLPVSNSRNWSWQLSSVGSLVGSYVFEIRVAATGTILAATSVSVNIQKQSYGITLGFPTSRTVSGTLSQQVQLILQGNSNNNTAVTATSQTTVSNNWNPGGHNRNLFQVRAVNISGTAPTSGSGTAWREANIQSNWTWAQTTVGSKSGDIRLEIREKLTGTIVASRNFSATVTRTHIPINLTVGVRALGGDKVVTTERGFITGSMGAVNPATINGVSIRVLQTLAIGIPESNPDELGLELVLNGNRAKNFWTTLVINGHTFNSSAADRVLQSDGHTRWAYGIGADNWPLKAGDTLLKGKENTTIQVLYT